MTTQKQIEANRRNSERSTGPHTAAGKAASRGNAMRTGIYAESLAIRGERPADLEQLTAEYFREWDPVTPRERDLVDSIVRNEWILRRMGLVEAELWNHYFKSTDVTLPGSRWDVIKRDFILAQGFIAIGANLERLQRRISAVERSITRARAELAAIRAQRDPIETTEADPPEDRATPSPEPSIPAALIPDPRPLTPQNGFVPSITEAASPEDRATPSPEPSTPAAPIPDPRPLIPGLITPCASPAPVPAPASTPGAAA